jgi:acetyl-CoA carboxylase biotin carboxyl carrier protein
VIKPNRKRGKPGTAVSRPADKALKPVPAGTDNPGGAMLGTGMLAEIRQLIRLVQRTGIGELEVSSGDRTVRIAAQPHLPANVGFYPGTAAFAPAGEKPAAAAGGTAPPAPPATENLAAISSPMVGTFYRAPAPDADPYVESGDMVEMGQTVCIIEAMKLMNEIESDHRGTSGEGPGRERPAGRVRADAVPDRARVSPDRAHEGCRS